MRFLKDIIAKKRDAETGDTQPEMSIETLQADLDHSGLDRSLRDPALAWSEKAGLRSVDENGPELEEVPGHVGESEPEDTAPDRRAVSRDLDWDDDIGDAGDAELREAFDAPRARRQTRPVADDDVDGSDDEFEELEDDEFEDEFDELDPEEEKAIRDNAVLVDEIRDAIAAVRHIETEEPKAKAVREAKTQSTWENDEVFGRKAIARDRLARLGDDGDDDRILEETNHKMYDDDAATRRRQAMAHLKAAAAATKADRVLKRVVGRDPAMDPDHQVQYREDLANVVRQRGPRSEPISRPLSRPRTRPLSVATTAPEISKAAETEQAPVDPMTHDQLREAFSKPVAAPQAPQPKSEAVSENLEPAEAKMDVEKIDLKTALERQKAILKAEREALEAEIAAESADKPSTAAAPALRLKSTPAEDSAPVEDFEPEMEAEPAEVGEMPEHSEDDVDARTDENSDGFDDWDDGLDEFDDEEEEDADSTLAEERTPEDARAETDEELSVADEHVEEAVRELDLALSENADEHREEVVESAMPQAAAAAPPRKAGRVKTRLLGFQAKNESRDVFAGKAATGAGPVRFPVGWLVITQGEGFGHSFSILSGVSKIGRGDDQAVQLDFGDTAISRDNHAAIAYDEELNQFFLGHGGKSNVVRLNGTPVLSTEELFDGDEIRIGETTLKFIALCSEEFTWAENSGDDTDHARSA